MVLELGEEALGAAERLAKEAGIRRATPQNLIEFLGAVGPQVKFVSDSIFNQFV